MDAALLSPQIAGDEFRKQFPCLSTGLDSESLEMIVGACVCARARAPVCVCVCAVCVRERERMGRWEGLEWSLLGSSSAPLTLLLSPTSPPKVSSVSF